VIWGDVGDMVVMNVPCSVKSSKMPEREGSMFMRVLGGGGVKSSNVPARAIEKGGYFPEPQKGVLENPIISNSQNFPKSAPVNLDSRAGTSLFLLYIYYILYYILVVVAVTNTQSVGFVSCD